MNKLDSTQKFWFIQIKTKYNGTICFSQYQLTCITENTKKKLLYSSFMTKTLNKTKDK